MSSVSPQVAAVFAVAAMAAARSMWVARHRSKVRVQVSAVAPAPTRSVAQVRRRRKPDPNAELLELLGLIGRNLAAGTSLSLAISESLSVSAGGPVHLGLHRVAIQTPQIGLIGALRQWGLEDVTCRRTAWALAVAAETGGDPLAAIDALTESLRAERALQRELGALTAQSRLSAAVLGLVPIGFGTLMSGTDAQARHFLLATAPGRSCLAVGLLLDAVAWRWLRSIGAVIT